MVTLQRLNEDIRTFTPDSKQYANTSWSITVAERYINDKQKELNELTSKREVLIQDQETHVVIAKNFYEQMGDIFKIPPALIQFVLKSHGIYIY